MKKKYRLTFNAPVVLSFVLISFVVTIIGIVTDGSSTQLFFMTYHSSLLSPLTYLRLVTHVFGHDGWNHFLGNTAYLLLLGPMLEEKYGSAMIIKVMIFTAIITGMINCLFFWNVALCGASGIVFAFIILASFTGFNDGEIPLTFILVALIYIGQQIYEGIVVKDDISNMAHVVGGIVGAITGYNTNRKEKYGFLKNKLY